MDYLVLDEEVPVMNVLGPFGTGTLSICSKKNDQLVVLVQYVVVVAYGMLPPLLLTPLSFTGFDLGHHFWLSADHVK